jgi:hypothetical protein
MSMTARDYLGQELEPNDVIVYVFEQALPIIFRQGWVKEVLEDGVIVLNTNIVIKEPTKHVLKIGVLVNDEV